MELNRDQYIVEAVHDYGYRVAFIRHGFGGSKIIDVAVENQDYSPMTISEIEKLHKSLVTKMFVENLIDEDVNIALGSPGMDRLLVSLEDFKRYIESKVKLSLKIDVDGRKKIQAIIKQVEGDEVIIELLLDKEDKKGEVVRVKFDDINQANLIPQINFSKVK